MLQIGYTVDKCPHYMVEGKETEVTVVIGPIRVVEGIGESGDKWYTIFSGCSRYYSCENPKCLYSRVAHDRRRDERDRKLSTSSLDD